MCLTNVWRKSHLLGSQQTCLLISCRCFASTVTVSDKKKYVKSFNFVMIIFKLHLFSIPLQGLSWFLTFLENWGAEKIIFYNIVNFLSENCWERWHSSLPENASKLTSKYSFVGCCEKNVFSEWKDFQPTAQEFDFVVAFEHVL